MREINRHEPDASANLVKQRCVQTQIPKRLMTQVSVKLSGVGPHWTMACQKAVNDLNGLFKQSKINVALTMSGSQGPIITVKTDPNIQGNAVHGHTTAQFSGSGTMLSAEVRLPVKVTINTPRGVREAGLGVLEVVAAHEFVHALGHEPHNSHLMAQTLTKDSGNNAAGDKLEAGSISMPPLVLSPDTVNLLNGIWP